MCSYTPQSRAGVQWPNVQEIHMIKLLAMAGIAALVTACAAPPAAVAADPMHGSRGSTETGASKAAGMGFHGPLDQSKPALDGPN
jgi:hypothetical protein